MIYALSFLVLLSPFGLAVLLTSSVSRRTKLLTVLCFAGFIIIFPIAAFWFGWGSGL